MDCIAGCGLWFAEDRGDEGRNDALVEVCGSGTKRQRHKKGTDKRKKDRKKKSKSLFNFREFKGKEINRERSKSRIFFLIKGGDSLRS